MILSAAIFITLLGLLGYLHFVKIDQETLLIIDSLGIQMTSSYASGKESTTFIEMGKVKDVVINEAIYMVSIQVIIISDLSVGGSQSKKCSGMQTET
jgi:phosphatidylinositol glycan class H protein